MSALPRRTSRQAFTLIELLVVISIIALLISIMLPALGAARAVARGSQCMAIEKQFGIANAVYTNDNQGAYLLVRGPNGSNPYYKSGNGHNYLAFWNSPTVRTSLGMGHPDDPEGVNVFEKNWKLICPDAAAAIADRNDIRYVYGLNNIVKPDKGFNSWRIHYEANILKPASKLFMTESNYFITNYSSEIVNPDDGWLVWGDRNRSGSNPPIINRYPHPGLTNNTLFFDGHVQTLRGDELWKDGQNWELWNPTADVAP